MDLLYHLEPCASVHLKGRRGPYQLPQLLAKHKPNHLTQYFLCLAQSTPLIKLDSMLNLKGM